MTKYWVFLVILVVLVKTADTNPTAQISTLLVVGIGFIIQAIHELMVEVRRLRTFLEDIAPSKPAPISRPANAKRPGE